MKLDNTHKEGQGKGLDSSRNLDGMVELHMISADMIKI